MSCILPLRTPLRDINQILPLCRVPLGKIHGRLRQRRHICLAHLRKCANVKEQLRLLLLHDEELDDLVAPVVVLELVFEGHAEIPHIESIDESFFVLSKNLP